MTSFATHNPAASVIVTNYNYAQFLPDCLESILAQSYSPIQIVVVDDGSTDNSREVLQRYASRIEIIWQENGGQAAAFNAGFARCHGEFIFLVDADDGWYPEKVSTLVNTFAAHPDVEWIRHKLALVTDDLRPYNRSVPAFTGSSPLEADPLLLMERIVFAGTSLAMRRSLADRVFPLQLDPDMRLDADDTMLLARIFAVGAKGYSLDRVLGFYRRHGFQRFSINDLPRLLKREAMTSTVLARMFASPRTPTATYKHDVVVGALEGASWWDRRRLGNYLAGLRSAAALWRRPALCARQTAALTFALVAPTLWVNRLMRAQPFYEPGASAAFNSSSE